MNRLLLLAIPLALAACSSGQAPQESAEDFASRDAASPHAVPQCTSSLPVRPEYR